MKKFKMLLIALLCIVTVGVIGCKKDADPVTEEFGVSITLPGKAARVLYDISDVESYQIIVTKDEVDVVTKTAAPGDTIKIKLIELGTYNITVYAISNDTVIAYGSSSVTFVEGDGYKDVPIELKPENKPVSINVSATWAEQEDCYTFDDAYTYDISIYNNDDLIYIDQFSWFTTYDPYVVDIPSYGTYKIIIEPKRKIEIGYANNEYYIIGKGEETFTITREDTYKDINVVIYGAEKEGGFGANLNVSFRQGYNHEKIQFGEWPQTRANVDGIVLEETGKTYDGNTEYAGDDGEKYVEISGSYYKVEPMTWRVIEYYPDGSKKLLADKIYTKVVWYGNNEIENLREIDGKIIYPNNYKYSNVRAYLNSINNQFVTDGGNATEYDLDWTDTGFFTSAFTLEEQARIKEILVDNSEATCETNRDNKLFICENTLDKVSLLSYTEVHEALFGFYDRGYRIMMPTEYAVYGLGIWSDWGGKDDGWYSSCWLLRSPSYYEEDYGYTTVDVNYNGDHSWGASYGSWIPGIVPAITIKE